MRFEYNMCCMGFDLQSSNIKVFGDVIETAFAADARAFEQAQIFEHRAWLHISRACVNFLAVLSRPWFECISIGKHQKVPSEVVVQWSRVFCLFGSLKPARVR